MLRDKTLLSLAYLLYTQTNFRWWPTVLALMAANWEDFFFSSQKQMVVCGGQ